MIDAKQVVFTTIAEVLGVEPTDISEEADFTLDMNATPDDISKIKSCLEESLDIVLPELQLEPEFTVGQLLELVEDSLL